MSNLESSGDLRQKLATELKREVSQQLKDKAISDFTITSLGDYCDIVELITEEWRVTAAKRQVDKDKPAPFNCGELSPWFRGVSNNTYKCEPTLFRFYNENLTNFKGLGERSPEIYEAEDYFFQRFKAYGLPYIGKWAGNWVPSNDLEWHFLMRHYEIPSRLLDWSKGSFISLYFAIMKSLNTSANTDSAVWMLEPRRLTEFCHYNRNIYKANRQRYEEAYKNYFLLDQEIDNEQGKKEALDKKMTAMKERYPLPIIPDLISPRITAHIGRFTLHTFEEGGMQRFAKDAYRMDGISYLVKINIPSDKHFPICRNLRTTGVSDMNFSQDLDGLTKELALRITLGQRDHNFFVERNMENDID
ncbi:MAG: FRG domain-containing protein [Cyanobacteria bacterium P01_F01_bin.150]